jgi:hypothetical protein
MNQKFSRQPPNCSSTTPSDGARIGANPMISVSELSIRAVSV